ncbi:MAG: hypothetical protein WC069_06150 [Candidatus Shapirobacteria bacterium]
MKYLLSIILIASMASSYGQTATKSLATGTNSQVLVGRGVNGADFWGDATNKAQIATALSGTFVAATSGTANNLTIVGSGSTFAGANVIYVSKATQATDTRTGLSKYDATRPFATLTAAQTVAVSGDTIMVLPGTYAEYGLGKDGVNWYFMPGSRIAVTANLASEPSRFLFTDGGTGMSFGIYGQGNFTNTAENAETKSAKVGILSTTSSATSVVFNFQDIVCGVNSSAGGAFACAFFADETNTIRIKGSSVTCGSLISSAGSFTNCAGVDYTVTRVVGGGFTSTINVTNDLYPDGVATINIKVLETIGSAAADTFDVSSLYGTVYLTCDLIKNSSLGQCIHPQGTTSVVYVSAKEIISSSNAAVFAAGKLVLQADLITCLGKSAFDSVVYASADTLDSSVISGRIVASDATDDGVQIFAGIALNLRNAVIVAGASALSIAKTYSGSNAIVRVDNVFSNKNVAVDVTQQVGTITISADVQ